MTTDAASDAARPLAGIRIVEVSSFVATPLAGMTLAQLGAEVIRVDPIGGAADYRRWPVTADGESIYWTGLNKGKRSVAANLRSAEGQHLVQHLIAGGGPGGGILITNVAGRQWLSFDTLSAGRPDLIHLEVRGRADGSTAVDYTVNAATGFPLITGPDGHTGPVNHVLPAWDVACGLYAALSIIAALRHRDASGQGTRITLPLENVALATAGNLGFLTEAMVNGSARERHGNAIYGQYGQDFLSRDGVTFMVVALTERHFRELTLVTGTTDAVAALAKWLEADFSQEGHRYQYRAALSAVFAVWFARTDAQAISTALAGTSILWDRYRTFMELADDERVTCNPMFGELHQPRIGRYLAAGLPMAIDGRHVASTAAPSLGDDTVSVLLDAGLTNEDIAALVASAVVATSESGRSTS